MDPLSLDADSLNFAALGLRIRNLHKLAEKRGLERIHVGLLVESERFKAWCHQTGINGKGGWDRFQIRLGSEAREAAETIMRSFGKWMTQSKVQLENTVERPGMALTKRIGWNMHGYKNLDESLAMLHFLNNGLEAICKPIMSYNEDRIERLVTRAVERAIPPNIATNPDPGQLRDPDVVSPKLHAEEGIGSNLATPYELEDTSTVPGGETRVLTADVHSGSVGTSTSIREHARSFSTQDVFEECLDMLKAVITALDDNKERNKTVVDQLHWSRDRLKIWGCCVFTVPLHLDQILSQGNKGTKVLGSCITDIFVDLSLIIESLLEQLVDNGEARLQPVLLHSRIVFSIHQDLFDSCTELQEEEFEGITQNSDFLPECSLEILEYVKCLFQTLPAVRRVQDICLFELESIASQAATKIKLAEATPEQSSFPEYQRRREEITEGKGKGKSLGPLETVIDTTAEMMYAIQLSIRDFQRGETQEKEDERAFEDALRQINGWEEEMERMKAWGRTLSIISTAKDSPEATQHNINIVVSLAAMASDVARAIPHKDESLINMLVPQIMNLRSMFPAYKGKTPVRDMKLKEGKSATEAFQSVQRANKSILHEVKQLMTLTPNPSGHRLVPVLLERGGKDHDLSLKDLGLSPDLGPSQAPSDFTLVEGMDFPASSARRNERHISSEWLAHQSPRYPSRIT